MESPMLECAGHVQLAKSNEGQNEPDDHGLHGGPLSRAWHHATGLLRIPVTLRIGQQSTSCRRAHPESCAPTEGHASRRNAAAQYEYLARSSEEPLGDRAVAMVFARPTSPLGVVRFNCSSTAFS